MTKIFLRSKIGLKKITPFSMSLLETIITLGITSLLTLACFSSYEFYYHKKVLEQSAEAFITNINYAKEASIISGKTVYLCASLDHQTCNGTWMGDLLVFTSNSPPKIDNILKTSPPLPKDITFAINLGGFSNDAYLYFTDNGDFVNNGNFSFSRGKTTLDFKISTTGIVRPAT